LLTLNQINLCLTIKLIKMNKKVDFSKLVLILSLVLLINLPSCKKDELLNKKTSVTFNISDEVGSLGDCAFRIIEPVADRSNGYTPVNKYAFETGLSSYSFDEVEPGNYAGLIGGIGDTYKEFSIAKGEHITINYRYYVSGYVTVGYVVVSVKSWSINVSKN